MGSNPHWLRPASPQNRVSAVGQGTSGRRLSIISPENMITDHLQWIAKNVARIR